MVDTWLMLGGNLSKAVTILVKMFTFVANTLGFAFVLHNFIIKTLLLCKL